MKHPSVPDLVGGAAVLLLGLFVFVYAVFSYRLGSATHMGPGYFPALLGIVAMLVGATIMAAAFRISQDWPVIAKRPTLWVFACVVAFIAGMRWLGFVPAVFVTVLVAAIADKESRLPGAIVLAAVIAAGTWLAFIVGLGMTAPVFKMPF